MSTSTDDETDFNHYLEIGQRIRFRSHQDPRGNRYTLPTAAPNRTIATAVIGQIEPDNDSRSMWWGTVQEIR